MADPAKSHIGFRPFPISGPICCLTGDRLGRRSGDDFANRQKERSWIIREIRYQGWEGWIFTVWRVAGSASTLRSIRPRTRRPRWRNYARVWIGSADQP